MPGPGLVLALWLKRLGIEVRIVDQTSEPGTTSRALAVHARTLELYRQVGLAQEVVERGLKFAAINLWARGDMETGRGAEEERGGRGLRSERGLSGQAGRICRAGRSCRKRIRAGELSDARKLRPALA